jgi:hypothetical protein
MNQELPIFPDYTLASSVVQGVSIGRQHFFNYVKFWAFHPKMPTASQSTPPTEQAFFRNLRLTNHFCHLPERANLGFAKLTRRNRTSISGGLLLTPKETSAGRFGGHSRVRMAATFVPLCPPPFFSASQTLFLASESSARAGTNTKRSAIRCKNRKRYENKHSGQGRDHSNSRHDAY